jgi:glycosyltransferase involved in cell wall biosynthesis
MADEPALSVVVPVYNSAETIGRLVDELSALEIAGGLEIILVNDGSEDESAEVAAKLVQTASAPVLLVNLSRNFGEHNALLEGIRRSRGSYLVTMDDDLQNPPTEVIRLYEHARKSGKDVIYASFARKQHGPWRNLGSWFANRTADVMLDKPKGLYLSTFRCMNRFIADLAASYDGPYPYLDGLILQNTNRLGSIEVQHQPRTGGRSSYTFRKLIRLWISIALNFSVMPLRICTFLGLSLSFLGLLGVIDVVVEFFVFGIAVPGWAQLIVTVMVFSGVQLLMLGLFGEYLGRLYLTAARRPQSVVREVIGPAGEARGAAWSRSREPEPSRVGAKDNIE